MILVATAPATSSSRYSVTLQTPGLFGFPFACTIAQYSAAPQSSFDATALTAAINRTIGAVTSVPLDAGPNTKLVDYGVRGLSPIVGVGQTLLRAMSAALLGVASLNDQSVFYDPWLLGALGMAALLWGNAAGATSTVGGALGALAAPPGFVLSSAE